MSWSEDGDILREMMEFDRILDSLRAETYGNRLAEKLDLQLDLNLGLDLELESLHGKIEEQISLSFGRFFFRMLSGAIVRFAWLLWRLPAFMWLPIYYTYVRYALRASTRIPAFVALAAWLVCLTDHDPLTFTTRGRPAGVWFTLADVCQLWYLLAAPILFRTACGLPCFLPRLHAKAARLFSDAFDVEVGLSDHVIECYMPTAPRSAFDDVFRVLLRDAHRRRIDANTEDPEYDWERRAVVPARKNVHSDWDMYISAVKSRERRPVSGRTSMAVHRFSFNYLPGEGTDTNGKEMRTPSALIILECDQKVRPNLEKLAFAISNLARKGMSFNTVCRGVNMESPQESAAISDEPGSTMTKMGKIEEAPLLPGSWHTRGGKEPEPANRSAPGEDGKDDVLAEKVNEGGHQHTLETRMEENENTPSGLDTMEEAWREKHGDARSQEDIQAQDSHSEDNVEGDVETSNKTNPAIQVESSAVSPVEVLHSEADATASTPDGIALYGGISHRHHCFSANNVEQLHELSNNSATLAATGPSPVSSPMETKPPLGENKYANLRFGFEDFEEDCGDEIAVEFSRIHLPPGADDSDLDENTMLGGLKELEQAIQIQLPLSPETEAANEDAPIPIYDVNQLLEEEDARDPACLELGTPTSLQAAALISDGTAWLECNDVEIEGLDSHDESRLVIQGDEDQILTDAPEPEVQQHGLGTFVVDEDQDMLDGLCVDSIGSECDDDSMMIDDQGPSSQKDDIEMSDGNSNTENYATETLWQGIQGDTGTMIAGMSDEEYAGYIAQQEMEPSMRIEQPTPAMHTVDPSLLAAANMVEQMASMSLDTCQPRFVAEEQLENTNLLHHDNQHDLQELPELPSAEEVEQANQEMEKFMAEMKRLCLEEMDEPDDASNLGMEETCMENNQPSMDYHLATGQDSTSMVQRSVESSVMDHFQSAHLGVQESESAAATDTGDDTSDEQRARSAIFNEDSEKTQDLGPTFLGLSLGESLSNAPNEPDFDRVDKGTSFNFAAIQQQEDAALERDLESALLEGSDDNRDTDVVAENANDNSISHPYFPTIDLTGNDPEREARPIAEGSESGNNPFVCRDGEIRVEAEARPSLHLDDETGPGGERVTPSAQLHSPGDGVVKAAKQGTEEHLGTPLPRLGLMRLRGASESEDDEHAATKMKLKNDYVPDELSELSSRDPLHSASSRQTTPGQDTRETPTYVPDEQLDESAPNEEETSSSAAYKHDGFTCAAGDEAFKSPKDKERADPSATVREASDSSDEITAYPDQDQEEVSAPFMMGGLIFPGGKRMHPPSPSQVVLGPSTPIVQQTTTPKLSEAEALVIKAKYQMKAKSRRPQIFHEKKGAVRSTPYGTRSVGSAERDQELRSSEGLMRLNRQCSPDTPCPSPRSSGPEQHSTSKVIPVASLRAMYQQNGEMTMNGPE